jgi:hypothetical protein
LDGLKVEDIAPNLLALVPARKVVERTVSEGIYGMWLCDCGPDLGEAVLAEFFILWQVLAVVQLSSEREDKLWWCWSEDGVYSSKLAHMAFFVGRTRTSTTSVIWRSRALMVASSLRGWFLETGAGRRIRWRGVGSLGLRLALFVTRS